MKYFLLIISLVFFNMGNIAAIQNKWLLAAALFMAAGLAIGQRDEVIRDEVRDRQVL